MEQIHTDILIIGSGVAGSYAAIQAAHQGVRVALVTKTELLSGSTRWAQGGVAFPSDLADVKSHLMDTIKAGRGLVDEQASKAILSDALSRLNHLTGLGLKFDPSPALEGGHSRPRVMHINGDESGLHLLSFLHSQLPKEVSAYENLFAASLLRSDKGIEGALFWKDHDPEQPLAVLAGVTIIATGGIGQIYSFTTNPEESTGDGIALAYRSGARLRDMELVQFHPTVLSNGGLISEACRGEGAILLNNEGKRFMPDYDPAAELAPRDIVARSIYREIRKTGGVFLDLRPIHDLEHSFPTVYGSIKALGLDPELEPVPVQPAAHFLMGGILTDRFGAASIPRLFAAGEVASTGFHGANRLASNSLLEGLVMGSRAAETALESDTKPSKMDLTTTDVPGCAPEYRQLIREVMGQSASVVRDADGLSRGMKEISEIPLKPAKSASEAETANMRLVALMTLKGALERTESRGSHYRSDFPETSAVPTHIEQQLSSEMAIIG